MMVNPSTRQASPLSSTSGSVGSLFSPSPRIADTVPLSSVSTHERRPQNSPFISQSHGAKSLPPLMHSTFLDVQATSFIDNMEENKDISWGQDSIQDLLDFPLMESVQNGVGSSTIALTSVDQAERTDWSDWDPMISIGDDLDHYWPDLPASCNGNATLDSKSKGIQQPTDTSAQLPHNYQNQPLPSEEHLNISDPSSSVQAAKPRMRWTQELHESFVECVAKLGGSERATPKGIVTLMNVPGLTIYHVKSHLQKYRTARHKPEPTEGVAQKNSTPEDLKAEEIKTSMGITEALRLQVELQKRLHDQLETQRKLQLQIEEQGKYLQKMFEQHKTMGNKFKASSSASSGEPTDAPISNKNNASEASEQPSTSSIAAAPDTSPQDASGKEKATKTKSCDETDSIKEGSDSPPAKRAKCC